MFINRYNTGARGGACGGVFSGVDSNDHIMEHSQQNRGASAFGVVQLDFDDFYTLMKLKIQYQRQSISQTHQGGKVGKIKGMGSVESAAVQAYGARLSMKPRKESEADELEDDDELTTQRQEFLTNRSKARFGISKREHDPTRAGHQSNVVVETRQENVSCFFWPFLDYSSSQYSRSNVYYDS